MCVISWAIGQNKRFPFVYINNRDELLARPTSDVALHKTAGGRTLLAALDSSIANGGTWCGVDVTEGGPFTLAALTNCNRCATSVLGAKCLTKRDGQTHPAFVPKTSRGRLVMDCLDGGGVFPVSAEQSMGFDGFNFISGSIKEAALGTEPLRYHTNRYGQQFGTELDAGVHSLANSYLDNFEEPKTKLLQELMTTAVGSEELQKMKITDVLNHFADGCLCATPNCQDVPADQVRGSKPFVGLSAAEKAELGVTAAVEDELWSYDESAAFHANVYQHVPNVRKNKKCATVSDANEADARLFKTRTQIVMLVEATENDGLVLHYGIRETQTSTSHGDWVQHTFKL